MIPKVTCNMVNNGTRHKSCAKGESCNAENDEPEVLKSNIKNRTIASFHRTANAFTEYPVKGLMGDVNSNFYEFLAMGRVAFWTGSLTLISIFNAASKYFDARGANKAGITGKKFATGVAFYALAKSLSKELVARPVAWATGVDIEQPYLNKLYPFPKVQGVPPRPGERHPKPVIKESPEIQYQYQKLWESKEFPRIDLVDQEFFDKVAQKNGLGTGLNCSEAEVKPILRNIISTATTAERVSSFLWAACGVCLAACGNWDKYYDTFIKGSKLNKFIPDKNKTNTENFKARLLHGLKKTRAVAGGFKNTFAESAKEFYKGAPGSKGFKKHAGKILFWTAAGSSIFGVANTIIRARSMGKDLCDSNVIDNSKDSVAV